MLAWFALLLITAVSIITGWLIIRPFWAKATLTADWLALLMASITLGTISIGLIALILAEVGYYSFINLSLVWLLVTFFLAVFGKRKDVNWLPQLHFEQAQKTPLILNQKWEWGALLLWAICASWLFLRPHQFVHGGADAGVYVNLSANINHTGSITFQDETFAQLEPAVQNILSRPINNPVASAYLHPAFFLTDMDTGEIQPQFYPFHPIWQAIAFAVGGVDAALLITGFWALLSSLAIYLFVRQIAGWETAVLTITALSLTAMQVWFARYPTTELQTQFYLWIGFWGTAVWLSQRQPTNLWAFLAGSSFGIVFLVRIDIIFILPILFAFIAWQWATKQKGIAWFGVPCLLLVTHAFAHALTQSRPYFFDLYSFGVRALVKNQVILLVFVLLALVGLWGLTKFHLQITQLFNQFRKPLLALVIGVVVMFALYNWFIRPYTVDVSSYIDQFGGGAVGIYNHENLIRLGWYLSPLGILLGVLGICWLVWRVNWETAVMLSITLFFTFFYLWNIRNNPHQIYAMRRYIPAVLPLFIVASTYLLHTLWQQRQKWLKGITLLLTVAWLAGIVWSARGFVMRVDYATLPAQLAQLNAQFDPNAIIIFQEEPIVGTGDFVGTPLRFLFHHDVYKLHTVDAPIPPTLADTIQSWQENGRTVYWIGDTSWLEAQSLPFATTQTTIQTSQLEGSYTHKPTLIQPIEWILTINKIQ